MNSKFDGSFFLFFSKIMFFHLILFICMIISIVLDRTYQVQTNLSVQTVQTSIWATRSTSRRRRGGGRGYFQKCDYPIQVRAKICKSPFHLLPWMLIWWIGLQFARFARRGWFAPNMLPFYI
jgi:hypothetical protein